MTYRSAKRAPSLATKAMPELATALADVPSKRMGRPPRISRESVVSAAAEMASADPSAQAISIGAIARQLKVTPAAIYSYFASRDELLQAVSKRLLEGLVFDFPEHEPPLERIRAWARCVRKHFLANPPLIRMLSWEGGRNSIAWLNTSGSLLSAVRDLNLDDETQAQTILWIWTVVLGSVLFDIHDRQTNPRLSTEEFSALSDAVREDIGKVDRFLRVEAHYERYFEFQVEQLIAGLAQLEPALKLKHARKSNTRAQTKKPHSRG